MELDQKAAEAEYKAWLEDAAQAAGSRRALNSLIATKIRQRTPGIDAKIRGWTNSNSLKIPQIVTTGSKSALESSLELSNALVSTVSELLPARETEYKIKEFPLLLSEVRRLRNKSQTDGVHTGKNPKRLYDQKILGFPQTKSKDLKLEDLNLGSGIRNGEVPTYCPRDIDQELLEKLNNPLVDLVTISGEPKVGKTRTLIHNLQKSELQDADVYWLRPGSSVLQLAESLSAKNKLNNITIIDDIQRWVQLAGSFPGQDLRLLRSKSKVLVTLHQHDLAQWRLGTVDHTTFGNAAGVFGPGDDFIEQIENSQLHLGSELGDFELDLASSLDKNVSRDELRTLGAYYSSSDFLISKFQTLATSSEPMMVATLAAVYGSKILYSAGVTVAELENLARAELGQINRSAYFAASRFEAILSNDLTKGVSVRSPHSILTANPDNPGTYSLFDPLWAQIKNSVQWEAPTAILTPENNLKTANVILDAGFPMAALKVLERFPAKGSKDYCFLVSCCHWEEKNNDLWRLWIERAADQGHAIAMSNLAYVLKDTDRERAISLLKRSADLGESEAFNGLGVIHSETNKASAEPFYRKAIELGNVSAIYNLAVDLATENLAEAYTLYQKALDAGDERAFYPLALQKLDVEPAEAERLFELAAINGDPRGYTQIGNLYISSNPRKAEEFFRKAADLGELVAMNNLGVLISDRDEPAAIALYEAALEDNPVAMRNLAMAIRDSNRTRALALFEMSANLNDALSMNELGFMLIGSDYEKAKFWLEKATELDEPSSKINLAWLLRESDSKRSLELLREVSKTPNIAKEIKAEALFGLGLHYEIENANLSQKFYSESADLGLEKSRNKLKDPKSARPRRKLLDSDSLEVEISVPELKKRKARPE